MPPRGIKKGTKRARQYVEWEGGLQRALLHAARFAPDEKQREACDKVWREFEKLIRRVYALDHVPAGSPRAEEAEQLYEEARKLGVEGRSRMDKRQLQRAVDAKKR